MITKDLKRVTEWRKEAELVAKVLENAPVIDKSFQIQRDEFGSRQRKVIDALERAGLDLAIVYSDEHYDGDVPYLAGNTNISIEPVAAVIGKGGLHVLAGLEGGYVVEQMAYRSGAKVHKVEMLKLADEDYPIDAEKVEDILEEAAGCKPKRIGLLTPRAVFPVSIFEFLSEYCGGAENIMDVQEIYYRIKYEKSDHEMRLLKDASLIADTMIRGMLAVLKPGMLETQVAQWGWAIARELGAEETGFDVMVTSGEANRTLIGKALNRPIREGDVVHLGVAPKRDGLTSCVRVSVVAVDHPEKVTPQQKYWFDFVAEAYRVGLEAYRRVAAANLPAKLQEQALVDFFAAKSDEVSRQVGKPIDMTKLKPYTGTHNGGYTECQEFFGAITLKSENPLGRQIVTMLDVAVRGFGNMWHDIVIPGLDYIVVERTLGKFGPKVEVLTELPIDVQHLVGNVTGWGIGDKPGNFGG